MRYRAWNCGEEVVRRLKEEDFLASRVPRGSVFVACGWDEYQWKDLDSYLLVAVVAERDLCYAEWEQAWEAVAEYLGIVGTPGDYCLELVADSSYALGCVEQDVKLRVRGKLCTQIGSWGELQRRVR